MYGIFDTTTLFAYTPSIQHYIDQHNEMLVLLKELKIKVESLNAKSEINIIVESQDILSKIAGNLRIHLAMEDKYLYPQLLSSQNTNIVSTAKKFMDEMGGLSSVFSDYTRKWNNSNTIKNSYKDFTSETKGVIDAIMKRIDQENTVLYPLIKSVIDEMSSNKSGFFTKLVSFMKKMFGVN